MTNDAPEGERQAEIASSEGPTSVLIAVGLLALSAYFAVAGFAIRVPEGWQTAPGMLPIILGISLFVMAGLLLAKALRAGAWRVRFVDEMGESSLKRAGIGLLVVGVYYFGLLAYLPFEVASSLFLLGMFWVFWPGGRWTARIATAIGLPILITLCFAGGFGLPLPGEGNLILLAQYLWVSH
jgi:hypothetical protein